ncbi:major capsid-like protein [Salmonella enterica subsp. enterica serovar Typhi]|nr:major capsid-like protein [Salmonella enterica subsp. enterica serovar Typhi]CQW00655.1 major capsid-like protein [Salmonella enterica subsp. enterica serovar Typhi]
MKKNTRFAFNAYLQQLARLNGVAVEELSSKFTVEPSVQQTLEDQIQQSAAFLTLINVTPVTEQSGQLLGLGVGSTIAGTTDTTAKEREPVDPTLMVDVEYKCEQTNFDTVLTYAKLDLWAKFQDFQVRIRDAIVKRQALDRIMIGFNGVKRAKTSNRSENPLLQDVNKGWLQKIREDAPDHVMGSTTTGGETTPGAVKVGKGGEYANLDAVVMDAVNELIDVVYQDDDDLVVICGRELLSDKYFPLVNKEQENSEKLAADMIISQKRMGGLQAVRAPFFPPNALLITRLDNLSIYWQEGTRRLKGVQSTVKKAEIKVELLPKYAAWAEGVLAAGGAQQDDVLMYVMLWRIDAGDYAGALEIGRHALRHGWVMPLGNRNVQTVLAEEMADAAQSAMLAATGFDADLLLQTLELTDGLDMPDQSRARLHKAIGAVLSESNPASALNHLNHALQLDPRCGVKKDKQQLERRLRNDSR